MPFLRKKGLFESSRIQYLPIDGIDPHPAQPPKHFARAGLDEEEALAAITINAARIAGLDGALGSLAPGKEADIVITDRPPLELLGQVRAVFMGGRRI